MKHEKLKFLIIGNKNSLTYKGLINYFKSNKIWLGYTRPKVFKHPIDNNFEAFEDRRFGNVGWFTNLNVNLRKDMFIFLENYEENKYKKYDNIDALKIDKIKEIPDNYYKPMGVPITFLDKYNPSEFEILDIDVSYSNNLTPGKRATFNGKQSFARIIVKRIKCI